MKFDLLLKNAHVISHEGDLASGQYIYIQEGIIKKISLSKTDEAMEEIDCSSYFVTPGLVNLHAHSPMNIFKGIAEDVTADDWFNKEIWPYESKMLPEDVYYGSMLAILEMLENGVTAFADHYFNAEMICKAVLDTGIRADIAPTIFGLADNFDEQVESASQLIGDTNGGNKRLYVRMGPHSPYTCNDKQLTKIIARAKELNVGMHLHVSETLEQVKNTLNAKTPFELLYNLGGFDIPTIVAHGLWIQEEDLQYINSNITIAACAKTYMKLGMGYGNIWKYNDKLPLAIGTDGAASSNTVNPIEQVKLFALVGKFMTNDPEGYRLVDMWKMLMKGHEALNFKSGKIEVGYAADLLVWNLEDVGTMPVYNPLAAIIYSSNSNTILHSIINGEFVKRDGRLAVNKLDVIGEIKKRARDILSRGKGSTKLVF